MGLDFLDVNFRIEKDFGVALSEDDLQGIIRNRDIRIGDLYGLILAKLNLQDNTRNSLSLNRAFWRDMQAVLSEVTKLPAEEIQLQTRLEVLFPSESRVARWQEFQMTAPYRVRELDYPGYVRVLCLLFTGLVTYAELSHARKFALAGWLLPVLGLLGLWMFVETHLKILDILSPLRYALPAKKPCVKDLCREIFATNFEDICQNAGIAFENSNASVWHKLVDILVDTLGVEADEITFRSLLIKDLDMA